MLAILDNGSAMPPTKQHPNAIVTICLGEDYCRIWESLCSTGWQHYCHVHGFDLIVVTDHLDNSDRGRSRSPAWEKLLVLVQPWAQNYQRIVWIDADIMISRDAPNVLASVPDPAKVGICLSGGQMSDAERHVYFERLYKFKVPPANARSSWLTYQQATFGDLDAAEGAPMFNSGVMVLSPSHHAALLRSIYDRDNDSRLHEQPIVSAELSAGGLAQLISPRFNWSVHEVLMLSFLELPSIPITDKAMEQILFVLRNEMAKAYFLHFCGSMPVMTRLAEIGVHSLQDDTGNIAAA